MFDDGSAVPTPRYQRSKLLAGDMVTGPALDRAAQFHDVVAARHIAPPCCRTATCTSPAPDANERAHPDEPGSRSDHAAGRRRRAALDRRADGQRALPHVLFLDHSREPGSRRGAVRYAVPHAVRIRFDADAYRFAARLPARHREVDPAGCLEAGRLRDPQPSVFRRQPLARHRHRDAGVLRGRTGRLLRQHRAPRRYRRGDTRPDHRRAGHVSPRACC